MTEAFSLGLRCKCTVIFLAFHKNIKYTMEENSPRGRQLLGQSIESCRPMRLHNEVRF